MAPLESRQPWTTAAGVPPVYLVRAAYEAACHIDAVGNAADAAHHAYTRHASGGIYPPEEMRRGEALLLDVGLLREEDGWLYPTPELQLLATVGEEIAYEALIGRCLSRSPPEWLGIEPISVPDVAAEALSQLLPDPEKREAFLIALGQRVAPDRLAALGEIGEKCVVERATTELSELGYADLVTGVRRVSSLSDQLGYDVVAPRPDGRTRRLEVKTGSTRDGLAHFFLSRNEADVGRRDRDWALVYCEAHDDQAEVIGWCRGPNLEPYLPVDAPGGRWRTVEITMPLAALFDGIPPAI